MEYTSPPSVTAGVTTVSAAVNNAYKTAIDEIGTTGLYPAQRQGGSETDWSAVGTTNYDAPQNTKMQSGVRAFSGSSTTVTFPEAFSQKPTVLLGAYQNYSGAGSVPVCQISGISITGFTITSVTVYGSGGYSIEIPWIAIGPA